MRYITSLIAVSSILLAGACSNEDTFAPQEPDRVHVDFLVEHWILEDPAFERQKVWIFKRVAVGNYPYEYTLERRGVYSWGEIPPAGEIVLSLPISVECDHDGTMPSWSITFEGTWLVEGDENAMCFWYPSSLDQLACTDGLHVVNDFETIDCTPTNAQS